MLPSLYHTARLHVDLDAICHNWRQLNALSSEDAMAGAVVKANAYGLGMCEVSLALYQAGCRVFFTARLSEAQELYDAFATHDITDAEIIVFDGILDGQEDVFATYPFIPTLNDIAQIERAKKIATKSGEPFACLIHIDTGMARLGLTPDEWRTLIARDDWADGLDIKYVMSHLASADESASPQNKAQTDLFSDLTSSVQLPLSLANSGGSRLGDSYHYDLTRPGLALYGMSPAADVNAAEAGLKSVIRLEADILQVREVPKGASVGYGASFIAPQAMRLATLGIGYADGFLRRYKDHVSPRINNVPCPLVGRISMDSCVVDISHLPVDEPVDKTAVIFDEAFTPKDLASLSDTIAYEIITTLGERLHRHYARGA